MRAVAPQASKARMTHCCIASRLGVGARSPAMYAAVSTKRESRHGRAGLTKHSTATSEARARAFEVLLTLVRPYPAVLGPRLRRHACALEPGAPLYPWCTHPDKTYKSCTNNWYSMRTCPRNLIIGQSTRILTIVPFTPTTRCSFTVEQTSSTTPRWPWRPRAARRCACPQRTRTGVPAPDHHRSSASKRLNAAAMSASAPSSTLP